MSLLAGGVLADGAPAAPAPSQKWCAWLGAHPEPSPQQDQAEERLVADLFAHLPLRVVQEILVEREVRRDYLRAAALIGNRPHSQRVAPTAFRREAVVWDTDRDPLDVVSRSTRALLADLQRSGVDRDWAARDRELAELEAAAAAVAPERRSERFAIYSRVCALRRQIAFAWVMSIRLERSCVSCHGQKAHDPPDLRIGNWQATGETGPLERRGGHRLRIGARQQTLTAGDIRPQSCGQPSSGCLEPSPRSRTERPAQIAPRRVGSPWAGTTGTTLLTNMLSLLAVPASVPFGGRASPQLLVSAYKLVDRRALLLSGCDSSAVNHNWRCFALLLQASKTEIIHSLG